LFSNLAALTRSESGALPAVEIASGGEVQLWKALSEKALVAHDDGNTQRTARPRQGVITLIALPSIVVGSGLLFWQHRS